MILRESFNVYSSGKQSTKIVFVKRSLNCSLSELHSLNLNEQLVLHCFRFDMTRLTQSSNDRLLFGHVLATIEWWKRLIGHLRKVCRDLYIISGLDMTGIWVLLVEGLRSKDTFVQRLGPTLYTRTNSPNYTDSSTVETRLLTPFVSPGHPIRTQVHQKDTLSQ